MRNKTMEAIATMHPYRVAGNAESYTDYAQGWTDACDMIESCLPELAEDITETERSKAIAYDQVRWERDIALAQLRELGYSLGEEIKKDRGLICRRSFERRVRLALKMADAKEKVSEEFKAGILAVLDLLKMEPSVRTRMLTEADAESCRKYLSDRDSEGASFEYRVLMELLEDVSKKKEDRQTEITSKHGDVIFVLPDHAKCKLTGQNPQEMDNCPICNFDDYGCLCVPELCEEYIES